MIPYEGQILSDILEARKRQFKQRLYDIAYSHFLKAQEIQKQIPTYSEQYDCDPFEKQMWPAYFDPHSVDDIPKANLSEVIKANKCQTISDFISQHDIKGMVAQAALMMAQEDTVIQPTVYQDAPSQTCMDDGNLSMSTLAYTERKSLTFNEKDIDPETGLSTQLVKAIKLRENIQKEAKKKNEDLMAQ